MSVTLTPRAQALLRQLAETGTPELIVEHALEGLAAERPIPRNRMTPTEAVERIRELRRGITPGDLSIKELINEGRKY